MFNQITTGDAMGGFGMSILGIVFIVICAEIVTTGVFMAIKHIKLVSQSNKIMSDEREYWRSHNDN